MAAAQATARLRRTFRYPPDSDSDSGSEPSAIDEQEQEALISRLAAANAARNRLFRRLLLALPLLAAAPYLPLLLRPRAALPALLALSSLLATAFLLVRLPAHRTGIAPLDAWAAPRAAPPPSRPGRPGALAAALSAPRPSPLEAHLPYLNAAVAAVLVLMGLVSDRAAGSLGWVGVGNLPAIVYLAVLVAKVIMGGVDPEGELSALRYDYRGA